MKPRLVFFILLCNLAIFFSCAMYTAPVVVGSTNDPAFLKIVHNHEKVYVLVPHLDFENAATEETLDPSLNGGNQVHDILMSLVPQELRDKGLGVYTSGDIDPEKQDELNDIIYRLQEEYLVLTSSYKDKSTLIPILRRLAVISGANIVCAQKVKAKLGASAFYNPFSGQEAQGTSTTAIKIAFISLETGDIIWKNEAMIRSKPTSSQFKNIIPKLFSPNN